MFYFLNSLLSVWKLTELSIKLFKIKYFSFTFKLNEKKKVLLKMGFGDRDYKEIVSVGGGWYLIGEMEMFLKRGLTRKG